MIDGAGSLCAALIPFRARPPPSRPAPSRSSPGRRETGRPGFRRAAAGGVPSDQVRSPALAPRVIELKTFTDVSFVDSGELDRTQPPFPIPPFQPPHRYRSQGTEKTQSLRCSSVRQSNVGTYTTCTTSVRLTYCGMRTQGNQCNMGQRHMVNTLTM